MRLLGLDIGTTTISAVVLDTDAKSVLQAVTVANDSNIAPGQGKMQDANVIIDKLLKIKGDLEAKYAPFSAIGVTGQMHGILYANDNGEAVSPLYTWQDPRGNLPYKDSTYAKYLSEITGYKLASGYGLVTDYINRSLGQAPQRAASLCTIHDYAVMKLTNNKRPIMHSSDAASIGCYSFDKACFDENAIRALGIDIEVLPDVADSATVAGFDPNGVPVAVAIGDNQASVMGSIKGEDYLLVNIGTGSQISYVINSPAPCEDAETRPLTNGKYILVGAPLCGGRSFALLHRFFKECASLFGGQTDKVYDVMDRLAQEYKDKRQLQVDTRFCGTRKDPGLRGSISGISEDNFTPAQLVTGFLWGMAKELRDIYEKMQASGPKALGKMAGSGNAIRKSPVLQSYLEEIFGLDLLVPAHTEEAAFGAALFAAVAAGKYESLQKAQNELISYK